MTTEQELVELQKTLYTSRNPTRRWLHCVRRDWIVDTIHRYSNREYREAGEALEVGPGSGTYLPILSDLFRTVYATDIEDAYLDHVRKLTNTTGSLVLVIDDIINTKLPHASFDLILCSEVIEHIADSRSAILQMHPLLKPGGILILSTPQRYSPLEVLAKFAFMPGIIQLVRLIYRESILDSEHINLMTERQVIEQIETAGFKILERYKSGMYLPLIAEFTGHLGLKLEQLLEKKLRDSYSYLMSNCEGTDGS